MSRRVLEIVCAITIIITTIIIIFIIIIPMDTILMNAFQTMKSLSSTEYHQK